MGYLRKFPNLATIKWLASTYQPNLKWVMGLNTQLSRQFQPKRVAGAGSITNFIVGWKVEASHFIVAALGNHTSSPRCSKIAHWEARACIWRHWKQIQEYKRMADTGSITYFMVVEVLRTSSSHYSKIAHWKAWVGTGRHWKQNEGMAKSKWRNGKMVWF